MDSSSNLRLDTLDKLRDDNFHVWKARIQLLLSLKDVHTHLHDDPPDNSASSYSTWSKADLNARAIIGLTLSDTHLEQVQHAQTAKHMWALICDIFEKHTLLNKLATRRRFYTAKMHDNGKVLPFAARIRQLAATLKTMSVAIEDSEMAMALLHGPPERFDSLISALGAAHIDDDKFTFEFVQSRCVQEEQRHAQRAQNALKSSESAALFVNQPSKTKRNISVDTCVHCGKHRDSSKCYKKFPHLAPPGHPARAHLDKTTTSHSKTLIATDSSVSSDPKPHFAVCLFTNSTTRHIALHTLTGAAPPVEHWIIDSGCTAHVTYDRAAFTSYHPFDSPGTLDLGADSYTDIVGSGDVKISLHSNGCPTECLIHNVLYVPTLRYQLLSVSAMAKRGIRTQFDEHDAKLLQRSTSTVLATATQRDGLYTLDVADKSNPSLPSSPEISLMTSLSIWHQRLAHVHPTGIKSMAERGIVKGINIGEDDISDKCVGCVLGKSHRAPIPKVRKSFSTQLLQLVHSDVLGPVEVPSLGGARYFVSFIDDFSKWTVVYTMTHKSKVLDCFKDYKALAEKHTSKNLQRIRVHEYHNPESAQTEDPLLLKALRSDNGGEYLSSDFKSFLVEHGIQHQLTVTHTPQQNGVAERMNRTLLNLVRSMLHHNSPQILLG